MAHHQTVPNHHATGHQEPENLTDEQLKIIRTWWTILVEPTRTEVLLAESFITRMSILQSLP